MNMAEKISCPICKKGYMEEREKKTIAETEYIMLKCSNCHHLIARSRR